MTKGVLVCTLLVGFYVATFAQDSAYYSAIQKKSASDRVHPAQFRQIELNALKNYSKPESYELLAGAFGNTTEKVWAVIYGETYCNLSLDSNRINQIGSAVYQWYEASISRESGKLSIDLTENAQASRTEVPFESQFEQLFLMGAVPLSSDLPPLSIKKLAMIRQQQLSLWRKSNLPRTELARRQEAIIAAGHFEAYNYWLFRGARAQEFNEWINDHQAQFQAWLDWRTNNPFQVHTPDFQRLYLLRKPSRSSTEPASLIHG